MVAEQVIASDPVAVIQNASNCIIAARRHLMTVSNDLPDGNTPIYISFASTHGYTGCVVWVYDLERARAVAGDVLGAFRLLHSKDEAWAVQCSG